MDNGLLNTPPPADFDAEIGVLGSLVLLPEVMEDVSILIGPESFFDELNGVIFGVLAEMHRDGPTGQDVAALVGRLESHAGITRDAAVDRIRGAAAGVANASHAVYYAKIVAEMAKYRILIVAATGMLRDGYDAKRPPGDIVADTKSAILNVVAVSQPGNEEDSRDTRVTCDKQYVTIAGHYEIDLDRIPDYQRLIFWVSQLSDKTWVSADIISRFVHIVCLAKGWKSRGLI